MYRTGDAIISLPFERFLNNIEEGNFGTIRKWRQQRGEGREGTKGKAEKKFGLLRRPGFSRSGLGVL
jgi:hypothetical protein